jgi:hypothetical protein
MEKCTKIKIIYNIKEIKNIDTNTIIFKKINIV